MYVQSFIKMYVQSFTKMYVQSFTNLTQDKSEWSTSKPCSLSPNEEPPLTSRQMARWAPQPVWMLWITEYLSLLMTALPQSHSPSAFNQLYLDIFFHLGFHLLWVPVLVWYHCSCSGVISLFLFWCDIIVPVLVWYHCSCSSIKPATHTFYAAQSPLQNKH